MLEKLASLRKAVFKPFLINIDPNIISSAALLAALFAGYLFWQGFFLLAAVFVLLNGFLDVLDGEIAKFYKKETKFGDFIDHAFDRIADVAILLGITLTANVPDWLGYSTIIAVLLVSYLGTEAQTLTSKRLYSGILGRSDRLIVLTIAGFLTIQFTSAIYWGTLLILVLSILTFAQRFWTIANTLKNY